MKAKVYPGLWAVLLSFCVSFGGGACMVTGLELSCSLLDLALCLLPVCLVCAFLLSIRRGGIVFALLLGAAALFALKSGRFCQEFLAMAGSIGSFYETGYGLILPDVLREATAQSHLMPLLAVCALIAASVCWTVLHRIPAVLSVFLSFIPIALCCVVTDTVPGLWCLLLWLFGLVLLLLSHPVRQQDALQGVTLTGLLAIPTALALAVAAILLPPSTYRPPEISLDSLRMWIADHVPNIGLTASGNLVISYGSELGDRVDLDDMDGGEQGRGFVMEVQTDFSGTLYLRAQDHDLYDGTSWSPDPERLEDNYRPLPQYTTLGGTVSVQTLTPHSRIYLPYWPRQNITLAGGAIPNTEQLTEYSFTRVILAEGWYEAWQNEMGSTPSPWPSYEIMFVTPYLALPDSTRAWAEELLEEIDGQGELANDTVEQAEKIAAYVRDSAVYDLNAPQMPEGYDDLAIWFLTEADSGYCTHFATATVVLLRAAGIPARYVEGYLTEVRDGRPTVVRQEDAHAWAEYYLPDLGWLPLESTPGFYQEEQPTETTEPTESETTQPPETSEPTDPTVTEPTVTEPTESQTTLPTETAPSEPADPGINEGKGLAPWVTRLLLWLGIVLAVVAVTYGQWKLRRRYRHKKLHRGSPNAQGLARFREARRLARLCKKPVPEELKKLADKACFSQHTLTNAELDSFDRFLNDTTEELKKAPLPLRLLHRYLFAAY